MRERGQVLVIVAVLLIVGLMLLALATDGGRLYVERGRLRRAAQSSSDAGISWVSDRMVTMAAERQTQAALRTPCATESVTATAVPCTATPELDEVRDWLEDEDRAALVGPQSRATARAVARMYAERNGIEPGGEDAAEVSVEYPYDSGAGSDVLRMRVTLRRQAVVLLAGLLGEDFVLLEAMGLSQIPLQ